jgi:hypothetical protein
MVTTGFDVEDGKLCPIKVSGIWKFSSCTQNNSCFLSVLKVGQEYGTYPSGVEITGKYFPQFAPTGYFVCVQATNKNYSHNWTWPDCS